ncbi:glycoside hydrolase family 26 protein [Chloroflexota bacterium]
MRRPQFLLLVFLFLFIAIFSKTNFTVRGAQAADQRRQIYFPLVSTPKSKLIGMYFQQGSVANQETYVAIVEPMKEWSGGKLSIIGTFVNFDGSGDYDYSVYKQLHTIWNNGYVPFVNIQIAATAYEVASGNKDSEIRNWAQAYKKFANGPNGLIRMAYLAPLQEMNSCQSGGCWTVWGGDPGNYKIAFRRIRQIFDQEGVPPASVRWVFAPNGWSHYKYDHPFEDYYPGEEWVDVVAISAYNFGGCTSSSWKSPQKVFNNPNYSHPSEGAYLDRMQAMAPGKPIFISQTGTAGSTGSKNSWLDEAHDYLANYSGVYGVLYFNMKTQCDWRVYSPPEVLYNGYADGVLNSIYKYRPPEEIRDDPLFLTR